MTDFFHHVWPFGDDHEDDRLSAFLDDELSGEEAMEVARHVASCPSCMDDLHGLRTLRQALRSLPPVDPPVDLYPALSARIAALTPDRPSRRTVRLGMAIAASAMLTGGAAVVAGGGEQGTVAPPVDAYVADHLARTDVGPIFRPVDLGR